MSDLAPEQLREATEIAEQIVKLEQKLMAILGDAWSSGTSVQRESIPRSVVNAAKAQDKPIFSDPKEALARMVDLCSIKGSEDCKESAKDFGEYYFGRQVLEGLAKQKPPDKPE
jgi:hypothetical protein